MEATNGGFAAGKESQEFYVSIKMCRAKEM